MTVVQRSPTAGIHGTQIVIPATAGIHTGGRRWVPVSTDGRRRRTHNLSFPRRQAAGAPTIIPATAGIHTGGRRWVPVSTGTTGGGGAPTIIIPTTAGGRRTHDRHSRDGGNPQRGAGDGFPSPPERRQAAGAPKSSFPPTAGIHVTQIVIPATAGNPQRGAGDGFPSPPERRRAAGAPKSSFPRRRESTEGGRRWVPVSDGRRRAHPHGNDGGRRAHPTIVIPATAGIHRGGPAMGSPLHRNDGGRRRTTIVIPATAGIHGGGPAMGSHRNDGLHNRQRRGGRRWAAGRTHTIVIPATAGIHRGGAGDGFPSPPERRWAAAHTQSSFPRRRESTQGAGDGFPSPRERRGAAAHTQSSSPRRRESTEGGRVPLSSSEQVPRRAGPRAASNVRYNDERRHRPPVDATAARGPDARWIDAAGGATDVSELR